MKMKWTLRSGRRLIGKIEQLGQSYVWKDISVHGDKDSGITDSLDKAVQLIQKSAGMSPRQYEFTLT